MMIIIYNYIGRQAVYSKSHQDVIDKANKEKERLESLQGKRKVLLSLLTSL